MTGYYLAIILHVLAMSFWIGHMLVWSLIVGPALKKLQPPATAEHLRERSLHLGGLGWPALAVLAFSGYYMLNFRGAGIVDIVTGQLGWAFSLKMVLVLMMVAYQAVFGHRRAALAIYGNMGLALAVLFCSVLFVRGVG